ncbi:unannotated protein [freshwater metagenome]|uniref:Unannotated protein n=1 Tax=freshwater metagenome TaxID=449393 RepID=A0A6J6X078_9ZZZZ
MTKTEVINSRLFKFLSFARSWNVGTFSIVINLPRTSSGVLGAINTYGRGAKKAAAKSAKSITFEGVWILLTRGVIGTLILIWRDDFNWCLLYR